MKKSTLTRILLLLALLIVPTASIHAQTPNNDDVVLFGQNYTLEEGETLNGSLAVFGGNIDIKEGAEVALVVLRAAHEEAQIDVAYIRAFGACELEVVCRQAVPTSANAFR